MELHLCGGRKYNGHEEIYWQSVRDFIIGRNLTQVLFVGTASETHQGPLALQFFREKVNLNESIQIFDAEVSGELNLVHSPVVYVLGGMKQMELINLIRTNKKLERIICTCPYYFGESMGAKLVGSKLRVGTAGTPLIEGLGILKDTVIEGHYTQKQRQQVLIDEVKTENLKYGLGIDEDAEVVTNPETFPHYNKLGPGLIELITNER
ncbi:MAG: Type 1 glutamine amidotransferase-like domain-containing protein [Patescibacteria group bacterium]